ncbi:hypothetical protein VTJ49DRAFT_5082 [Mycothermus thermophilus]|uniref:DUF1774-domain-containing protein n=1 Tax=Humicola insolens TaxID=85995 RepID=A0ABR3V417_HUMIN
MDINQINPFARRESHGAAAILWYRLLTVVSWALAVAVTVYHTFEAPHGHHKHPGRTIWDQNRAHPSGFTLNSIIASVYWISLFVLQLGYVARLFSPNPEAVYAACCVGSHFILHNLLHSAFVALFVHSRFVLAELVLLVNFFNLSALYFRHTTRPTKQQTQEAGQQQQQQQQQPSATTGRGVALLRLVTIHLPAVSGPLAWTFVAIYWNGAIMVPHQNSLPARILANVFVWSILGYGSFFLLFYRDYTMGFSLSVLAAALAVGQFLRQIIALQWIFGFSIMAVLFVLSLAVALPEWAGVNVSWPREVDERAPLLAEPRNEE